MGEEIIRSVPESKEGPETTTPAGGGGPAGVVLVALHWEEEEEGHICQAGRRRTWQELNALDRLAGDERNVAAGNAEVVKFAVG